jgi:hypothetical protein
LPPGIRSAAYRVDKANWKLFTGLSAATLVLNGDGLPSVSFRCAVTLSTSTGHTDVAGTVTVGGETLTFTVASKKVTSNLLTALPVITTSVLDCNILIEALNSAGANILKETLAAITCLWVPEQKRFQDAQGIWTLSAAIALTETACDVEDIIRYSSKDYIVKQIMGGNRVMGVTAPYKLWLTG